MPTTPASSRYLSDFSVDLHHYLEQTELFSKIIILKTGLRQCALNVVCTVADSSKTQQEIAETLERVWREAPIGYAGGANSCRVTMATGEVQMHFVVADNEVNVTGRIEVLGFK